MASAFEQAAANFNFAAIGKATELKKRIWFTLFALIVYRLGSYIPVPGVDPVALEQVAQQTSGGILAMFDALAGGALRRMSIFALNIMPYISASIIIQLLTTVSPHLEQLKKEGEAGRKKINQYTRYGTVILSAFQGYGIAVGLESIAAGQGAVIEPGLFFRATTVISLVGGTVFLMWLGEQITARGVGNGISLIIFSGIVARLPIVFAQVLEQGRTGFLSVFAIIAIFVMVVVVVTFIVFMERARRRIVVQYPKRQTMGQAPGNEQRSHLPLKVNTAGVIPPIFASSLLLLPVTVAGFQGGQGPSWLSDITIYLGRGQPVFMILFAALIIFFSFFYTSIILNPEDTAENLKKYGGFVPGIRPGKHTAEYIDSVLTRITVVGSIYLAAVCLLPEFLISQYSLPFYFGGTSLLIVISVTMDTVEQIQSHLLAQQYEGLIKKAKLRRRR